MGRACSKRERIRKGCKILVENLKGRDRLRVLFFRHTHIIVKKSECECVNWMRVAQDRDKLQALVKTVLMFLVQKWLLGSIQFGILG